MSHVVRRPFFTQQELSKKAPLPKFFNKNVWVAACKNSEVLCPNPRENHSYGPAIRPAKAINSAHAVSSVNCHSSSPRNITIIIKQRLIYEDELTAERSCCRPLRICLMNLLAGRKKMTVTIAINKTTSAQERISAGEPHRLY